MLNLSLPSMMATSPSASVCSPPGHRWGEGAASVLPPLREDARHRRGPEPTPSEHPCIEHSPENKDDLNDRPGCAGAEGLRSLAARRMEV